MVSIPVWVPAANPGGMTETVMVPLFIPEVGVQCSQDTLLDTDQFNAALPLLMIKNPCGPVDNPFNTAPNVNWDLFKEIEAGVVMVIEKVSLSP